MKNTVKLLPPTDERFNTDGHWVTDCYTDSRYTFGAPTMDRKYVRTLLAVRDFQRTFHIAPTKSMVALALGEPDPTKRSKWSNLPSNWGTSRWNALHKAGLLDHVREKGNRVVWFLTPRGVDYLKQLEA